VNTETQNDISFLHKLGAAIQRHRSTVGLTRSSVAYRCDLNIELLQDIEDGIYVIDVELLERLARALDTRASELVREAGR
jgi:ribosome-binding protein aMBF1 (putative translation factor)